MLLVPKQLRRAGMTGNVPYYGGRFSPAQAYAASHRSRQPLRVTPSVTNAMGTDPGRGAAPAPRDQADPLLALQQLLDTGVITPDEYQGLRARVTG